MNSFENTNEGQNGAPGSVNPQVPQNPADTSAVQNSTGPACHQIPADHAAQPGYQGQPYGGQPYGGPVPPHHTSPYADSPYASPHTASNTPTTPT